MTWYLSFHQLGLVPPSPVYIFSEALWRTVLMIFFDVFVESGPSLLTYVFQYNDAKCGLMLLNNYRAGK